MNKVIVGVLVLLVLSLSIAFSDYRVGLGLDPFTVRVFRAREAQEPPFAWLFRGRPQPAMPTTDTPTSSLSMDLPFDPAEGEVRSRPPGGRPPAEPSSPPVAAGPAAGPTLADMADHHARAREAAKRRWDLRARHHALIDEVVSGRGLPFMQRTPVAKRLAEVQHQISAVEDEVARGAKQEDDGKWPSRPFALIRNAYSMDFSSGGLDLTKESDVVQWTDRLIAKRRGQVARAAAAATAKSQAAEAEAGQAAEEEWRAGQGRCYHYYELWTGARCIDTRPSCQFVGFGTIDCKP